MHKIILGIVISLIVANTWCANNLVDQGLIATMKQDLIAVIEHANPAELGSLIVPQTINSIFGSGRHTPLIWAVRKGNKEAVQQLLEHGALPGLPDCQGLTALHHAARLGDTMIAKLLLQAKPVEITDDMVRTLLASDFFNNIPGSNEFGGMAAYCGVHESKIPDAKRWLLKNSAHKVVVDGPAIRTCANPIGIDTPLVHAAQVGKADMIAFLLEQGADCNHQDRSKDTALHYAARSGRINCVRLLIQRNADLEKENNRTLTPLAEAFECRQWDTTALLLAAGADTEVLKLDKPLHVLCYARNITHTMLIKAIIPYFVNANWNLNEREYTNKTPLMSAIRHDKQGDKHGIMEALLHAGADINRTDEDGDTALHHAAHLGNCEVINLLLQYGARFTMNEARNTPLDIAGQYGNSDVIKLFTDLGYHIRCHDYLPEIPSISATVDMSIPARPAKSLVAYAPGMRALTGCNALINHVTQPNQAHIIQLYEKIRNMNAEQECNAIASLVLPCASNHRDHTYHAGRLLDDFFIQTKDKKYDEILVEEGKTLLMCAVKEEWLCAVQYLLDHMDVDAKDDYERTALHYAAGIGNKDIIALLLARNACPTVKDIFGGTPRDYAQNIDLLEFFDQAVMGEPDLAWPKDAQA